MAEFYEAPADDQEPLPPWMYLPFVRGASRAPHGGIPADIRYPRAPAGGPPITLTDEGQTSSSTSVYDSRRALPTAPQHAMQAGDTMELLKNRYLKSFQDQEQGIQAQLARLEQMERLPSNGPDLTPLMALTDAWTGSKLAPSYKAPKSTVERQEMLAKLENQVQGQRSKLSAADLAIFKSLFPSGNVDSGKTTDISGSTTKVRQEQPREARAPRPMGGPQQNSFSQKIRDEVGRYEKGLGEHFEKLGSADDALKEGRYGDAIAVLGHLARGIGGETGALATKDIDRVLPRTLGADMAAVETYLTNNPGVKLDPSTVSSLRRLIKNAKKRSVEHYDGRTKALRDTYSSYTDRSQPHYTQADEQAIQRLEKRIGERKLPQGETARAILEILKEGK